MLLGACLEIVSTKILVYVGMITNANIFHEYKFSFFPFHWLPIRKAPPPRLRGNLPIGKLLNGGVFLAESQKMRF